MNKKSVLLFEKQICFGNMMIRTVQRENEWISFKYVQRLE